MSTDSTDAAVSKQILDALYDMAPLREYALARQRFLTSFGCGDSCRDPLTEISEHIVAKLLDAIPAQSRVERGYDLIRPNGRRVQVRSLSNPTSIWKNGHTVEFKDLVDDYGLVAFEEFAILGVLVFPRETLSGVCELLKKRHLSTDRELQLTAKNFTQILENRAAFAQLGVLIFAN